MFLWIILSPMVGGKGWKPKWTRSGFSASPHFGNSAVSPPSELGLMRFQVLRLAKRKGYNFVVLYIRRFGTESGLGFAPKWRLCIGSKRVTKVILYLHKGPYLEGLWRNLWRDGNPRVYIYCSRREKRGGRTITAKRREDTPHTPEEGKEEAIAPFHHQLIFTITGLPFYLSFTL